MKRYILNFLAFPSWVLARVIAGTFGIEKVKVSLDKYRKTSNRLMVILDCFTWAGFLIALISLVF